jgi:hypothetical protein
MLSKNWEYGLSATFLTLHHMILKYIGIQEARPKKLLITRLNTVILKAIKYISVRVALPQYFLSYPLRYANNFIIKVHSNSTTEV